MNKEFQSIALCGMVKPGEIYLLKSTLGMEGPGQSQPPYTIRTDEEVIAAMDMHVHLIHGDRYELRKFLGTKTIYEGTGAHVIKLLCWDKLYCVNVSVRFFLCRLMSFQEKLVRVRDIYDFE